MHSDLIKGQSRRPVPEIYEYELDRSAYDYASDPIATDVAYVRILDDTAAVGERSAYRFKDDGTYQVLSVSERYPSAEALSNSKEAFYGVYGVARDARIIIEF